MTTLIRQNQRRGSLDSEYLQFTAAISVIMAVGYLAGGCYILFSGVINNSPKKEYLQFMVRYLKNNTIPETIYQAIVFFNPPCLYALTLQTLVIVSTFSVMFVLRSVFTLLAVSGLSLPVVVFTFLELVPAAGFTSTFIQNP